MKRFLILTIALVLHTGIFFGQDTTADIDGMRARFDLSALHSEYDRTARTVETDSSALLHAGKTLSYLMEVTEAIHGETPETGKMALQAIEYCKRGIAAGTFPKEERADSHFIMARMYDRMIRDAASWMKYSAEKEKQLDLCLLENPGHFGAKVLSASKLLHLPENAGGDPKRGRALLEALNAEAPGETSVLMELALDALNRKQLDRTEDFLTQVVTVNPDHIVAMGLLGEIAVMKKNPVIHVIRIEGKTKTPEERLLNKLSPFLGRTYSFETKTEMIARLTEISSIGNCTFRTEAVDGDKIDISVTVGENNLVMLGAMGLAGFSLDYDKDIVASGYPVMLYMDQNFLGTADNLMLIFAGPYINLDYFHAGLFADKYLDLRFHWESMFLENVFAPVEGGKPREDLSVKSPNHFVTFSLGKTFPVGFSAFANAKVKYENWSAVSGKTAEGFTLPSWNYTYNPSVDLSFSTMGQSAGSRMESATGFKVQLTGDLLYKQNYAFWGPVDGSYSHDGNPQYKFSTTLGYGKKLFDRQNLMLDLVYMTGSNLYPTEKWITGKGALMSPAAALDGFYSGEFVFTNGVLGNIGYHIIFIPSKLSSYLKYDVLYIVDSGKAYHGSAFGIVAKLPWDIELTGQAGIGLNAEREQGLGYEFDVMLSRLWFF